MLDFAGEHNIRLMELAGEWWHFVDGEFAVVPGLDLEHVMRHADKRGVGVILYWDNNQGGTIDLEDKFRMFSEMGAVGVKYGFMGNDADFTRRAIDMAARYRLTIFFHDRPCPMTGVRRTMPNALTREYNHAQQDSRTTFTATNFLKMAMVNALTGPLDMSNGAFGLDGINRGERRYGPRKLESYNSTVAAECARILIIFSGLDFLPDAPEEYRKKADLFEFIAKMPGSWDETRVVNSSIGRKITTARRSGEQWFVGSAINESGGTIPIALDFLNPGIEYEARLYEDASDTHYIRNRESYRIRDLTVRRGDVIKAVLAPGGGHCMWIRPASSKALGGSPNRDR